MSPVADSRAAAVDFVATTDEQLMLDVRGGSRAAFEALFDRYRDPVWRFFRRRVPARDRSEELAQDTFVAVLEGAPRYRPEASFRSYLFGIAYNILLADARKRLKRRSEPLDTDLPAPPPPDRDGALWVRRALAQLPADGREILMLREYEQLSYQEIAELRRLPLNTVRTRLFRARAALKDTLLRGTVHGVQEHGSR